MYVFFILIYIFVLRHHLSCILLDIKMFSYLIKKTQTKKGKLIYGIGLGVTNSLVVLTEG